MHFAENARGALAEKAAAPVLAGIAAATGKPDAEILPMGKDRADG